MFLQNETISRSRAQFERWIYRSFLQCKLIKLSVVPVSGPRKMVGNAGDACVCPRNVHLPLLVSYLQTGSLRDLFYAVEAINWLAQKSTSQNCFRLFTSLKWKHVLHVLNGFTRLHVYLKALGVVLYTRVDWVDTRVLGGPRRSIRKPSQQREHHSQAKRSFKKSNGSALYFLVQFLAVLWKLRKSAYAYFGETEPAFWCYGSHEHQLYLYLRKRPQVSMVDRLINRPGCR